MNHPPSTKTYIPRYDSDHKARDIEKDIKKDAALAKCDLHLLIMGVPGSGKSTILNHWGTPLPQDVIEHTTVRRDSYRDAILLNTINAMHTILKELSEFDLTSTAANEQHASNEGFPGTDIPLHNSEAGAEVYTDSTVKTATPHSKKPDTMSRSSFDLGELEHTASSHCLPFDDDIKYSSDPSMPVSGIKKYQRKIGEFNYIIWDVDEQRGQRRKWMNCFEKITAVIFVVPFSSYDETDTRHNGIMQSLTLFDEVCKSTWLKDIPTILFLNKIALFAEKLPTIPLSRNFPDFRGGSDFQSACEYMLNRFVSLNQNPGPLKSIYAHYTELAEDDSKAIKKSTSFIITCVGDILLQKHLHDHKLLSGSISKNVFKFFKS